MPRSSGSSSLRGIGLVEAEFGQLPLKSHISYSARGRTIAAAARPPQRDPARNHIEHRREDQAEDGDADHAGEHGGAERLPQLGAGADRPDQRRHAEDEGERVIRIGRSRSRAASTAASQRSRP